MCCYTSTLYYHYGTFIHIYILVDVYDCVSCYTDVVTDIILMVYTYFTYQDSMIDSMILDIFPTFSVDVCCWCFTIYGCLLFQRRRAEGRTPPAGRGPKTRGRSAFCFRRGPLGQAVVVTLPQAVGNVRKVLKKLRRETRKLHRNLESLWHFLNIWNIYPNYSSSFWRWFFHFQIFQCFFPIAISTNHCVGFLMLIFFGAASQAPHLSPSLNLHQNCLNIRRSIDIEQYRQYTIT